jgi:hypothetical protein
MHRLQRTATAMAALAAVFATSAAVIAAGAAEARQGSTRQERGARPSTQQPNVILRDRWLYGPPPPPSSERNYYGPAPGIQQPMERVPLPPPLAQPPTNR